MDVISRGSERLTGLKNVEYPISPLVSLDTLWFQVAGTVCNLRCRHCFISCSPANHSHEMMPLAQVQPYLDEAARLGVKEYYFTGGEPFLNRELLDILAATLRQGPASVLTNGTLISARRAERLRKIYDASEYSLDLRISLDGYDASTNDPIRGSGSFGRILEGIRNLASVDLNPVITVTEACDGAGSTEGRLRFLDFLRSIGLLKPRLKILPLLHLGEETKRSRAYQTWESLRGFHLAPAESALLQCSSCRIVSSQGVYVCPILVDFPSARMGGVLAETLGSFSLRFPACYTCHLTGFSCRT